MLAAAVAFSVACACVSALLALRWVLAHREKSFVSRPLADMQRKLDELEQRLLSEALRR